MIHVQVHFAVGLDEVAYIISQLEDDGLSPTKERVLRHLRDRLQSAGAYFALDSNHSKDMADRESSRARAKKMFPKLF